jgi:hypothetical protein
MLRRTPVPVLLALTLAVLAALPCDARAQSGGFVITSQPSGAVVELSGELVLRGVTPWRLDRPLAGAYEVRAFKSGYEIWEGYTVLSASRTDSLAIRMVRKTPLKAGFRSAILPGWGQYYTGQGGKGAAFAIAEAAALAGVLWTDAQRQQAQEDYDDAAVAYGNADQIDEIEAARVELFRRHDELNKWYEQRKRWSYAAAAIWLANVLDASLLFPSPGGGGYSAIDGEGSGFFASIEPDRTAFGVAVRF